MKKLGAFVIGLAISGVAFADLYKANFSAPGNQPGRMLNYGFVVDLQFAENGAISGDVKEFYGASACRWPGVKLTGGNLADGNFRWISDENPIKGCGKLVFVGKKETDKLVGYLPRFQGVKIELELSPTN